MPPTSAADPKFLEAALVGLQHQLADIDRRIAELRAQLAVPATVPILSAGRSVHKRGPMSAATKKRMAIAQRRRWEKYRATVSRP